MKMLADRLDMRWLIALGVASFYVVLAMSGAPSAGERAALREQFHLPPDVSLSEVRVIRKNRLASPPAIEGVVRFSETQFRDYVRCLDDPKIWKPAPLPYDGLAFDGPYSPEAIVWRDLPGKWRIAWGSLSWKQAQEARNGKLLCFAVRQEGGEGASASFHGYPCSEAVGTAMTAVFVQGLIDFDSKTLHMIVRGVRAPNGAM
jgi:hypothetical protein